LDLLEDYGTPDTLYLARGDEVNRYRPVFTGDIFLVPDGNPVIVLAHPCSIRGRDAELLEWILVAEVRQMTAPPPIVKWRSGYFRQMPLPDLEDKFQAADFSSIRSTRATDLLVDNRIACLSQFGVNLLQQRLVFHLTRFVAPSRDLDSAFSHTFTEAELLEEWVETRSESTTSVAEATKAFEIAIQQPFSVDSAESLQDCLRDPQLRAPIRKRLRAEANKAPET
jgi:hypothetical protein